MSNPLYYDEYNDAWPYGARSDSDVMKHVKETRKEWLREKVNPRTQKARGIRALNVKDVAPTWGYTPEFDLIQTDRDLRKHIMEFPCFVRPCPVRPRHGFVDSRVVNNEKELVSLWRETKRADREAEMVIMKPIKCLASMVLTDNGAAIGPGNSGATSGNGSISLPLAKTLQIDSELPKLCGVTSPEIPYYEILCQQPSENTNLNIWPVQCRAGPATVGGQGDYVSQDDYLVTEIIYIPEGSEMDLLEFEKRIQNAQDGSVIHHPGGTRLSHYAVHGIVNNIPVLFDHKPILGERLVKTEAKIEYDMDLLSKGITHGYTVEISDDYADRANAVYAAVYGLHHAAALSGEYSFILGMAIGLFIRVSFAACIGEVRHTDESVVSDAFQVYADGDTDEYGDPYRIPRESVYTAAFDDLLNAWEAMHRTYECYMYDDHDSGYGGGNWANCTINTINFVNAVTHFQKNRSGVTDLLSAFNKAVNQVHNNGWMLNKFVTTSTLDGLAEGDPNHTVRALFATYFYSRKQKELTIGGNVQLEPMEYRKPTVKVQYRYVDTIGDVPKIGIIIGYRGNVVKETIYLNDNAELYGYLATNYSVNSEEKGRIDKDNKWSVQRQLTDENWRKIPLLRKIADDIESGKIVGECGGRRGE